MSEVWKCTYLPESLFDRLTDIQARILKANDMPMEAEHLKSQEKQTRTGARVKAMEILILICEHTSDSDLRWK